MIFTQGEEEGHILAACAGLKTGRFLDIGAWSAKTFSNTRALYERGWSGLLIEPSPEPFLGLLKEYGNDDRVMLLCAALGFDRSMVRFFASADALSTTQTENYEKWKDHAKFDGHFWIPTVTLPEILNQFGGFDMVSIDTEGTSVDVFKALLATGARPLCIVVEHDGRGVEIAASAQPAGYHRLYVDGNNEVWTCGRS